MQKIPFEKMLPIAFYALLIAGIGIMGYVGMSRRADSPALEAASGELTEAPKVIALTRCEAAAEKICILSTGYDAEGNLLVSLRAALQPMPPVYARLVDGRLNVRLDCRIVDISPRLLYCLGPFAGNASSAVMELYMVEGNSLLASGLLIPGEAAQVPETPVVGLPTEPAIAAPTPASYPGDSTPSYPSYPTYP